MAVGWDFANILLVRVMMVMHWANLFLESYVAARDYDNPFYWAEKAARECAILFQRTVMVRVLPLIVAASTKNLTQV